MNTTNKTTTTMGSNTSGTNSTTLSHELVARDEQIIGCFFAAFAIQYFLHKDMLNNKLIAPQFINVFSDIEVCASQRIYINNLIGNSKKYIKVIEELQLLYLEYCSDVNKNPQPYLLFLSRINKSFLIRQIFNHTDRMLEKYQFIEDFVNKDKVDLDKLNSKIWHFPVEQQILILARIYSSITDEHTDKIKTILVSYRENLKRLITEIESNKSKYNDIQKNNIKFFRQSLLEYDEAITPKE